MKIKNFILILLIAAFSISIFPKKARAIDQVDTWETKHTNNTMKVWKINFNEALSSNLDSYNIKDYIYIEDANHNKIDVSMVISRDRKSVDVYYPYYGYEKNKYYYIVILSGLKSYNGNKLKKELQIPFIVHDPIYFSDANLEKIIRNKINKPSGVINYEELQTIKELDLSGTTIYSLYGIKNLVSLEKLNLSSIDTYDFSELQFLINLKELNISNTSSYNYNKEFLSYLTKLEKLNMEDANVFNDDLKSLINLDSLEELNLKNNINITSIIDLKGKLNNLIYLNISDTGVKYENPGEATLQEIVNSFPNLEFLDTSNLQLEKDVILNGKITFKDKNLENAIREILKRYSGDIYGKDVKNIEELDLQDENIVNLDGMENFIGLKELDLSNNEVITIEPLGNLTKLEKLVLHNNNISITGSNAIGNLVNLKELYLSENNVTDIFPLEKLVNLKRLDLSYNNVQKIDDLSSLKNLEYLSLYDNEVGENRIVSGQPTPPADLSPLKYLFNLKELFLGKNLLIESFPEEAYGPIIPYYERLIKKDFDINPNEYEVIFGEDINNSDEKSALEKKIRGILNNNGTITYGEVKNISTLDLSNCDIKNLDGIQYFTALTTLDLSNNTSIDSGVFTLEPVENLKSLKVLNLSHAGIKDKDEKGINNIEYLGELQNLKELRLDGNNISHITPLSNLTSLTTLYLPIGRDNDFYLPTSDYYFNLTNKNFTLKNQGSIITIERINDIFYNINVGDRFNLPSKVSAKMNDSSTRDIEIIWDNYNVDTSKAGVYNYYGTVEEYTRKIKLTLNVRSEEVHFRGNSLGNIMNKGLAASDDKYIYYSNLNDGGKLYRESIEGGEAVPLTNDEVSYINVYDGWIYFLSKGDMYRVKNDGSNLTLITSGNANYINLVDGFLYYFDATKGGIWKIDIEDIGYGEVKVKEIVDKSGNPDRWDLYTQIAVDKDYVYFQNLDDSLSLYKMRLDGRESCTKVYTGEVRNINIYGDYVYFTEGNRIYRIKKDGSNKEVVTTRNADYINVYDGWVYFRNDSSNGRLYKVKTDGSNLTKLSDDKVRNINITDQYIFYVNERDAFKFTRIER